MTLREFQARLARRARKGRVAVPADLARALWAYFDLLSIWNKKINLTGLGESDEAIDRLLIEPLVASRYLPARSVSLLDVGSGSGSPAIPLKLAVARMSLVLVESKTRKAAFLREVVRRLDLSEVRVETARYEELLARPELHEAADVLTVRAVRVETRVLTSLQAFLAPGGQLFWFRGAGGTEGPTPPPPLVWEATYPLVESLRSRLVILRKRGAAIS